MKATLDNAAVTFDQMLLSGDGFQTSISADTAERPNELNLSNDSSVEESADTSLFKQYGLSVEADGFSSKSPSPEKDGAVQLAIPKKLPAAGANKPKLPPKPKLGDMSKLTTKTQVRRLGDMPRQPCSVDLVLG